MYAANFSITEYSIELKDDLSMVSPVQLSEFSAVLSNAVRVVHSTVQ